MKKLQLIKMLPIVTTLHFSPQFQNEPIEMAMLNCFQYGLLITITTTNDVFVYFNSKID